MQKYKHCLRPKHPPTMKAYVMSASIKNLHFHKMTHQFMSTLKLKLRNFRIYLHLQLLNTLLFKRICLVFEEKHFHLQINISFKVLCDIDYQFCLRERFVPQTGILSKFDSYGNYGKFFLTELFDRLACGINPAAMIFILTELPRAIMT